MHEHVPLENVHGQACNIIHYITMYRGVGRIFMEGGAALCARTENQSHAHFDHTFQLLRTSDDLLTGLRRKQQCRFCYFMTHEQRK